MDANMIWSLLLDLAVIVGSALIASGIHKYWWSLLTTSRESLHAGINPPRRWRLLCFSMLNSLAIGYTCGLYARMFFSVCQRMVRSAQDPQNNRLGSELYSCFLGVNAIVGLAILGYTIDQTLKYSDALRDLFTIVFRNKNTYHVLHDLEEQTKLHSEDPEDPDTEERESELKEEEDPEDLADSVHAASQDQASKHVAEQALSSTNSDYPHKTQNGTWSNSSKFARSLSNERTLLMQKGKEPVSSTITSKYAEDEGKFPSSPSKSSSLVWGADPPNNTPTSSCPSSKDNHQPIVTNSSGVDRVPSSSKGQETSVTKRDPEVHFYFPGESDDDTEEKDPIRENSNDVADEKSKMVEEKPTTSLSSTPYGPQISQPCKPTRVPSNRYPTLASVLRNEFEFDPRAVRQGPLCPSLARSITKPSPPSPPMPYPGQVPSPSYTTPHYPPSRSVGFSDPQPHTVCSPGENGIHNTAAFPRAGDRYSPGAAPANGAMDTIDPFFFYENYGGRPIYGAELERQSPRGGSYEAPY